MAFPMLSTGFVYTIVDPPGGETFDVLNFPITFPMLSLITADIGTRPTLLNETVRSSHALAVFWVMVKSFVVSAFANDASRRTGQTIEHAIQLRISDLFKILHIFYLLLSHDWVRSS